MLSCRSAYPQHKNSLPKAQSSAKKNIREGLDMSLTGSIILTAHSSQLTAHSSRRKYSLDSFFPTFHKHNHFPSVYTQKQTAKALRSQRAVLFFPILKYVQNLNNSARNSALQNYHLHIVNYPLLSALYRNAQYAVWFDTG